MCALYLSHLEDEEGVGVEQWGLAAKFAPFLQVLGDKNLTLQRKHRRLAVRNLFPKTPGL